RWGGLMGWVGLTHVRRHHEHYHRRGTGHLYQGRFKSFPVAEDDYFLTLWRYVQANPMRAKLVERAEQWRWCELWRRAHRSNDLVLSPGPWSARGTGRPWSMPACLRRNCGGWGTAWDGAAHWDQRTGCWRPPPG